MTTTKELMKNAWRARIVIPAFNMPYLPIMAPVVRALQDANSFGLIAVSRPEWEKFEAKSLRAVREEYERVKDERVTRLHLDHVPVVDEDGQTVDYQGIIAEAIELGYQSVMVDGSRLDLDENIAATRSVVDLAHAAGIAAEAELGAVLGHEVGPALPYEELFATGKGFTDPDQARKFVEQTQVDWLSIAVGSIHGAISEARRNERKVEARLNIEHLDRIRQAANVPFVLHGGSGIGKESIMAGIRHGIAKINIGTTVRQAYVAGIKTSAQNADQAVYDSVRTLLRDELEIEGTSSIVNPQN